MGNRRVTLENRRVTLENNRVNLENNRVNLEDRRVTLEMMVGHSPHPPHMKYSSFFFSAFPVQRLSLVSCSLENRRVTLGNRMVTVGHKKVTLENTRVTLENRRVTVGNRRVPVGRNSIFFYSAFLFHRLVFVSELYPLKTSLSSQVCGHVQLSFSPCPTLLFYKTGHTKLEIKNIAEHVQLIPGLAA